MNLYDHFQKYFLSSLPNMHKKLIWSCRQPCPPFYKFLLRIPELDQHLVNIIDNKRTDDDTSDIVREQEEYDNQYKVRLCEINPFQKWADNVYAERK